MRKSSVKKLKSHKTSNSKIKYDKIKTQKTPKKRGRKPKNKIIEEDTDNILSIINNDDDYKEESIIAQIPIRIDDSEEEKDNTLNLENSLFKKTNKEDNIKYKKMCKKYEKEIELLKNKNEKLLQKLSENKSIEKPIVNQMKIDFVDIDGKWKKKTNICCWWCCHTFDNTPCGIPDKYYENKFHVFGCFCSYECAMAYNNDINDYKVWERNSLIKLLCKKIYENKYEIKCAPPRQTLKIFGGILNIEEFRKNNINSQKKEYRYILPPMISMVPYIETCLLDNKKKNIDNNTLVLKRSKPLPNAKNSLHKTMKLKKK